MRFVCSLRARVLPPPPKVHAHGHATSPNRTTNLRRFHVFHDRLVQAVVGLVALGVGARARVCVDRTRRARVCARRRVVVIGRNAV